ncbi:LptF/LptG family permease [Benzoatithermus flavus]|uniref:LptF/LptG family permease n=1 Tax=Benzoatithermus flavus TaxID=3108223 RepID=A0ABU8XUP2_9PROT
MKVLTRYLNRLFLVRFAVVLFGIVGFAAVIDLIDVGAELVKMEGGGLSAGLRYFGLRLPIMLSELMPIAALIAGLLTVADLLRHRELVVIWSSGIRPLAILRMLLPVGLVLVGAKFAIDDFALPRATMELRIWGIGEYRRRPGEGQEGEFYWVRSGDDIVQLSAPAAVVGKVEDITIYRRDPQGILTERLQAASATPIEHGWRLLDVTRSVVGAHTIERLPSFDWPGVIDLARIKLLARPPRELALSQLWDIARRGGYGLRAPEPYRTWLHERIASAFVPMLLMMLGFALVRRFSRTASIAPVFMTAVGIGFTLIIMSGVASALGEVGVLAPALAAWGPPLLLGAIVFLLGTRGDLTG